MRRQTQWISCQVRKPSAEDADVHERVWAVALDSYNRPYPCEAFWKHVAELSGSEDQVPRPVYTHWMRPEWGVNIKQNRRHPEEVK